MAGRCTRIAGLVLAMALGSLTLVAWGLGSPVGSAPDEGFHLVSVWCGGPEPIPDCKRDESDPKFVIVPGMMTQPWLCFYGRPEQSAACQGPETAGLRVRTDVYNAGEYPTTYYSVARRLVTENIEASVQRIRALNLIAATALLVFGLALHGRRGWRLGLLLLVAFVPLGTFFASSVNPTGLAIASVTAFALAATSLTSSRPAGPFPIAATTALLLAAMIASIARRDSTAYCALLGVIALTLDASDRFDHGKPARESIRAFVRRPSTIIIGLVSSVLAAQFVVSGIAGVVTTGLDGTIDGRDSATVLVSNLVEMPRFLLGFFAGPSWGLGWFDTNMPLVVSAIGVLATVVLVRGLGAISRRSDKVALIGVFTIIVSGALVTLQADLRIVGESVQPRYFYPLFLGILLLLAARSESLPSRNTLVFLALSSSVAHSIALRTNIRRYVSGLDVRSWNLGRFVEWWWIDRVSPTSMWLIGTLAFGSLSALCVGATLRLSRV